MDEDRREGAFKQTVGKIRQKAGELLGDKKTEAEGRAQRAEGRAQNTMGGIKDSLRENHER